MTRVKVGVLISGRGSNMLALVEASKRADYPAEIACVIADRADAMGVELARAQGIPAQVIERGAYADKASFEAALVSALDAAGVEVVALAGFMRLLSPDFVGRYAGRILNIHPSLLPAFKGLDTHARALAAGVAAHGCSVHVVTAALDDGPVLAQARVAVLPGDTAETLSTRVLAREHQIYPAALAGFVTGLRRPL